MNYRPEIDGLRAIAVISVILYHVDPRLFSGGFLGVDVFFVISGFLITQVIIGDLKKERFTFAEFYERRARRILPALFLVLLACIPFAMMWMLPSQSEDFAQSVLAATLFSSNFLFWSETGYFMAAADVKPLLHTWSLAVEEQYYFIYPIIVIGLWRFARRFLFASLAFILVLSFIASLVMVEQAPAANFYLLPSRAWELLSGALVALLVWRPQKWVEPMAIIGLSAIVISFFIIDTATPIPSAYALPLVIGTQLLLLAATKTTYIGRILAWRPLVGIGLISYSAYLWHLPLFAFARIRSLGHPEPLLMAGLAVGTFALAAVSYYLVERPFRVRGEKAAVSRQMLVCILSFTAAILVSYGLLFGVFGARISFSKYPGTIQTMQEQLEQRLQVNFGLHIDCESAFTLSENCRTFDEPEVMLWGDSFAMHLAPALVASTEWQGLIQHTKSVCTPVVGISTITAEYPASWAQGCIDFNDDVMNWLGDQESVRYVVISSPFSFLYDFEIYMRDGTLVSDHRQELVRQQLLETARIIAEMDKQLIIVSPPPVTGENLGQCLSGAMLQNLPPETCDFTRDEIHHRSIFVNDFLRTLGPEIPTLFLDDLICDETVCDTLVNDTFIYRDGGHLSVEGSRYLGEEMGMFGLIEELANNPQ